MDDEINEDCSWCGGEGLEECGDPIQCMRSHIGEPELGDFMHDCSACEGSGLAKDQWIW